MSEPKFTWGKRLRGIQKERKCALIYMAIDVPGEHKCSFAVPADAAVANKLFFDALKESREKQPAKREAKKHGQG